jgi:hypothetical protein
MLNQIRSELEKTAGIQRIEDRASALDSALTRIKEILEDEELTEQERKVVGNLIRSHCRQFLVALQPYGNSGYSEALPIFHLVMNHAKLFLDVSEEEPEKFAELKRFVACIGEKTS